MASIGLTSSELKRYAEFLVKANDLQLGAMRTQHQHELNKRLTRTLFKTLKGGQ